MKRYDCGKWITVDGVSETCKLPRRHVGPCQSYNNTGLESVDEIREQYEDEGRLMNEQDTD